VVECKLLPEGGQHNAETLIIDPRTNMAGRCRLTVSEPVLKLESTYSVST
jgi:hypothetical protein